MKDAALGSEVINKSRATAQKLVIICHERAEEPASTITALRKHKVELKAQRNNSKICRV